MGHIEPNPRHDSNSTDKLSTNLSRRSFLIKGAVTAPILASFVAKPVWAVDDSCIGSGSMSGNMSKHLCAAVSRSAQWWSQASQALWPENITPDTMFKDLFQLDPLRQTDNTYHRLEENNDPTLDPNGNPKMRTFNNKTLQWILINGTAADKEFIAAFLNISHAGIEYSGINDPALLFGSYQQTINNYMLDVLGGVEQNICNTIFDNFAISLALSNTNFDQT